MERSGAEWSGVERANSKTNSNPLKINTHTRMSSGVKRRQKNSALKALERIKAGGGGGQIKFKGMHAHVAQLKKVDNKLKVMVGASSRPRPLIDGENGVGSGSAGGRTFLQLYNRSEKPVICLIATKVPVARFLALLTVP